MLVVFSFSYSDGFKDVSARGIYTKEDVIKDTTGTASFEITEVTIKVSDSNANTYFEISKNIQTDNFINGQNLEILNVSEGIKKGNRIYFLNKENNQINTIKFSLKGTLIFNWKKLNNGTKLAIGYRGEDNKTETTNSVTINLEEIDPIDSLKVIVKKDMDLGKGIAGTPLDSKSDGESAIIKIVGTKDKDVKIIIPETATITNSKGDSLTVELCFDQNKKISTSVRLKKGILGKKNSNLGETEDIEIHGRCQSKTTNRGKYTGSFIVRVEYND